MTDALALTAELAPAVAQASAAHAHLKVLELQNQQQVDEVGATLLEVKRRWNEHDAARKALTEPIRASEKVINDAYRPVLNWLAACETELKRALGDFSKKESARTAALMAQAQARVAEGRSIEAGDSIAQIASTTGVKGITTKPVWHLKIVDPLQVPREFLVVDEKAILAYAKEHPRSDGSPPYIAGTTWIEERQVIARPGAK